MTPIEFVSLLVIGLLGPKFAVMAWQEFWQWRRAAPDPVQIPAVQTITEERLGEIFLAAPDAPLWKAVLALIDLKQLELLNRTLDETLPEGQTKYHLGGAAALQEFKVELLQREQEARQTQRERENLVNQQKEG